MILKRTTLCLLYSLYNFMIPNTILDYELKLENEIQAEWNE